MDSWHCASGAKKNFPSRYISQHVFCDRWLLPLVMHGVDLLWHGNVRTAGDWGVDSSHFVKWMYHSAGKFGPFSQSREWSVSKTTCFGSVMTVTESTPVPNIPQGVASIAFTAVG